MSDHERRMGCINKRLNGLKIKNEQLSRQLAKLQKDYGEKVKLLDKVAKKLGVKDHKDILDKLSRIPICPHCDVTRGWCEPPY